MAGPVAVSRPALSEAGARQFEVIEPHVCYRLTCPGAMVVFGVDFGHTNPQWVLPYGGRVTVDGPAQRIIAHF